MIRRNLLTLRETASVLSVKYPRVAELARHGTIPVVRLGRQVRVDPGQLEGFISKGGKALAQGWRRDNQSAL